MMALRKRPVRARIYQPVTRFGVVATDWKYIIAASLVWLWLAEGLRPDRFDLAGATFALVGAGIILAAPR